MILTCEVGISARLAGSGLQSFSTSFFDSQAATFEATTRI